MPLPLLSVYPGNANNLVFKLSTYRKTIEGEDQGVVNEFVNPKFKDDGVTFKKPTRLECMMQDFPLLMRKEVEGGGSVGEEGDNDRGDGRACSVLVVELFSPATPPHQVSPSSTGR